MDIKELKKTAAEKAVDYVESGMIIGLGTGSTTYYALLKIAELLRNGKLKNITGVPSSVSTKKYAEELKIPLTSMENIKEIDVTIDGADEVDPDLNLIKGGGGALLREKVLAQASRKEIIIVDESKLSPKLGTRWVVPVEIIPFAENVEKHYLESLGAAVQLRKETEETVFITDEGNYILDAKFGPIDDLNKLAGLLEKRAGIVEHGLFIGLADEVISAGEEGIKIYKK